MLHSFSLSYRNCNSYGCLSSCVVKLLHTEFTQEHTYILHSYLYKPNIRRLFYFYKRILSDKNNIRLIISVPRIFPPKIQCHTPRFLTVPNLGDTRVIEEVVIWVHLYQWGIQLMLGGTEELEGWEPRFYP
jgi:hypothetical protein